jgi:hypothetical protein
LTNFPGTNSYHTDKMNTRTYDLNELEAKRDAGSPTAKRILDKVYEQSKDPEIERLRRLLIEAHKRRDIVAVEKISAELNKRG